MQKTLLILGGSNDQLPLLLEAKEMGLNTICVDKNPDSPGFRLAGSSLNISTRDVETLLDTLRTRRIKVHGVLTMGSDIPDVLAHIAHELDLFGPSQATGELATSKLGMGRALSQADVPTPWRVTCSSGKDMLEMAHMHGAVVIKPADRSGSRGVFLIRCPKSKKETTEMLQLFERSRDESFKGKVLAEEYVEGPQISTEVVMWDDRAKVCAFADRNYEDTTNLLPQFMENGITLPSRVQGTDRALIEQVTIQAAKALGIRRGTAKADIVLSANGPAVIEMAARLSGSNLIPCVELSSGVNYPREAIRMALGEEPDWKALEPKKNVWVANRYFFPPPGEVVRLPLVHDESWVKHWHIAYKAGQRMPRVASHGDRFGYFTVVAQDYQTLMLRVDEVYEKAKIEVSS